MPSTTGKVNLHVGHCSSSSLGRSSSPRQEGQHRRLNAELAIRLHPRESDHDSPNQLSYRDTAVPWLLEINSRVSVNHRHKRRGRPRLRPQMALRSTLESPDATPIRGNLRTLQFIDYTDPTRDASDPRSRSLLRKITSRSRGCTQIARERLLLEFAAQAAALPGGDAGIEFPE